MPRRPWSDEPELSKARSPRRSGAGRSRPNWGGKLNAQDGPSVIAWTFFSDECRNFPAQDPDLNVRRLFTDQRRHQPGDAAKLELDLETHRFSWGALHREGLFAAGGDGEFHQPWLGSRHQHRDLCYRRIGAKVLRYRGNQAVI